jgi:hypothetical protein
MAANTLPAPALNRAEQYESAIGEILDDFACRTLDALAIVATVADAIDDGVDEAAARRARTLRMALATLEQLAHDADLVPVRARVDEIMRRCAPPVALRAGGLQ